MIKNNIDISSFSEEIESKGVINNVSSKLKRLTKTLIVPSITAFAVLSGTVSFDVDAKGQSFADFKAQQQSSFQSFKDKRNENIDDIKSNIDNKRNPDVAISMSMKNSSGTGLKYLEYLKNNDQEGFEKIERQIQSDLSKMEPQSFKHLIVAATFAYVEKNGDYPNSNIDAIIELNNQYVKSPYKNYNVNTLAFDVMSKDILEEKSRLYQNGITDITTEQAADKVNVAIDEAFYDLPNYLTSRISLDAEIDNIDKLIKNKLSTGANKSSIKFNN